MRRAAAISLAIVAALFVLLGASGEEEQSYRVDALFDNAAGLIPGQDVKIAGARVGSVSEIHLTGDRKARVQMEIAKGFAPFRSDADCVIRPQSLIGEKFVQCDPGTPRGRPLAEQDGAPTVPVGQTHSPVDLDLVFASLRRPYRERLAILLNELGTGLAGRPEDLSEAIRRANPALQETRKVLQILGSDRAALSRLVERSDQVIAELSKRDENVTRFVDRADVASRAVASRRDELSEAVRLLPDLLRELEPSANRLAALSEDATPLVRDLRRSAEPLRAVLADLGPLSDATRPALVKLSAMSKVGRRAVRSSRPVAAALRPVARPPAADRRAAGRSQRVDAGHRLGGGPPELRLLRGARHLALRPHLAHPPELPGGRHLPAVRREAGARMQRPLGGLGSRARSTPKYCRATTKRRTKRAAAASAARQRPRRTQLPRRSARDPPARAAPPPRHAPRPGARDS